ncbi:MAG: hypothetical protein K2K02_05755, partial [Ruminococcus sp.]|nr:hypothetical protein [Ruminococcus sp.]
MSDNDFELEKEDISTVNEESQEEVITVSEEKLIILQCDLNAREKVIEQKEIRLETLCNELEKQKE